MKFEILEDIPKLGGEQEPGPPPKKKRVRKPRDPSIPTVMTGAGRTMALCKDLPLYRQPLLSVADKYKMTLDEVDRLRLLKAKEQARSSVLMQALAQVARLGPEFQKIAKDAMNRADDAYMRVEMKDLVKVTLNSDD